MRANPVFDQLLESLQFRYQTGLAYARGLLLPPSSQKFVVFAQGRTGSWLLHDLLNHHPQIEMDKEVLQYPVYASLPLVTGHACGRCANIYGCHIQIRHLRDTQGVNPQQFLRDLHERQWQIIYLRRENYLRQSISSMVAVQRRIWKSSSTQTNPKQKVHIDCTELQSWLRQRQQNRIDELEALNGLPHMEIVYESDLLHSEKHQSTLNRIFEMFNVSPIPAKSQWRRLGSDNLTDIIQNYDEVAAIVEQTEFGAMLYD